MKHRSTKQFRVLAVAPSSRGFGFAVMEEGHGLLDWGVKAVKGDRNEQCLAKVANLLEHYAPTLIALEDIKSKGVRRASRIQALVQGICALAEEACVKVKLCNRSRVREKLILDRRGTKYQVADHLASRYPEELGTRRPRKRKLWMSEDYRMDIFDAVALAQFCFDSGRKPRAELHPAG